MELDPSKPPHADTQQKPRDVERQERELQLKEAELRLKQQELEFKQAQESFRFSPATLASLAALLASLSGLAGGYIKGVMDSRVERQRFQQQLLTKALDNPDPEQARRNVAMLVVLRIIDDPSGTITRQATQLPAAIPQAAAPNSNSGVAAPEPKGGQFRETPTGKLTARSADRIKVIVDVGELTIPYTVTLDDKTVMFSLVDRSEDLGNLAPGVHRLSWSFTHVNRGWHHRIAVSIGGGPEVPLDQKSESKHDSDSTVGTAIIAVSPS